MASSIKLKRQREQMWLVDPLCEKCGVLTFLPKASPMLDGTKPWVPSNMATIQHVYSKLHPKRREAPKGERRHLLWCHKCNKADAVAESQTDYSKI